MRRGPYLLATQHAWGQEVYDAVSKGRDGEPWILLRTADAPETLADVIENVRPRYAFFVHWSAIVPPELTERYECVNFHCTPLPYGRGGHPIENMILAGHRFTVMTAHRMTSEIDAGPVYGRIGGISLDGTREEIIGRFARPVATIVRHIVDAEPVPEPQCGVMLKFKRLPKAVLESVWRSRQEEERC